MIDKIICRRCGTDKGVGEYEFCKKCEEIERLKSEIADCKSVIYETKEEIKGYEKRLKKLREQEDKGDKK